MKAIMTGVALAALIAAAPAGAQTQPQQPAEPLEMQDQGSAACPEGATETATGEACPSDTSATAPDEQYDESKSAETGAPPSEEPDATTTGSLPDENAEEPAAAQIDETQQTKAPDMVAEEGGKFIGEQADDAILASELVGQTVYNPADEALGDVNDVVWYEAGDVEGVIIGVGGFLGIGEKDVAVSYEALEITTDQDGNKILVLDATHDELAAAPEFVTQAEKLAMVQAEQEAALPPPAPGGGMTPAPAPAPTE